MFCLTMAACHNRHDEHGYEDLLYKVECHFQYNNLDSAQYILDTIPLDALSEKETAHLCLMQVLINDTHFDFSNSTDSLLQIAKQYYLNSPDDYHATMVCESVARVGYKRGMTLDQKLEWNLKGLQCIEKCQHVDPRLLQCKPEDLSEQDIIDGYKYKMILRIGMDYSMGDYSEEAILYGKQAYHYYACKPIPYPGITAAYLIGTEYTALKEYDSCLKYFDLGWQMAQQLNKTAECAHYHNLMSNYYCQRAESEENLEQKQQLLRQSISESFKGLMLLDSDFHYKDGIYSNLADAYEQLGMLDSCIYYDEQYLDFMKELYDTLVYNTFHADICYRLSNSYAAQGNPEKALLYAQLYMEMSREINQQPKNMEKVKNDYEKQLEIQKLESEQQLRRYRLYLLIAFIMILLMMVCWLYLRYRKNRKIEDLRFQMVIQKMQMDLEQTNQHARSILIQQAMKLYRSKHDQALTGILDEFHRQYPEAFDKLKDEKTDLNETEKRILILSFLGFRVKEEAELLQLSENTVKKYRSNLKKKGVSFDYINNYKPFD